ncbi:tail fiber protein [Pseudomonas phage Psxphi15]
MDLIKYDMTDVWAVAGDVVAPDSEKIRAGWGVEVVPRQWWNWFENRQDNNIAYLLQKGIPEWDATTEYIINKSYVQRNGIVYRATATSTNSDPVALTSWVKAFVDSTPFLEAVKGLGVGNQVIPAFTAGGVATYLPYGATGLASLAATSQVAGRTAIDAQQANSNLTALSGVAAAANQLPYFTGTTAAGVTTLTSFGRSLIDDNDAAAARATLGLTSSATTELVTGPLDTTAGRITTVGSFGTGKWLNLQNTVYTTGVPQDVFGVGTVFGLANGGNSGTGLSIPGLTGTWYGTLQVNSQYPDATGLSSTSRTFITTGGRTFTQTAASATAWGTWSESWTTSNLVKTTSPQDSTTGRMLQVGDFGFGKDSVNISDPDTVYRGSGFYDVAPSVSWAANPIPGSWTRIFHQSHANTGGYATQIASGNFATAGATPRMFVRYCINGVWSAFVELYHTGNTAQIVAQVQAGIQPTLDAKVSKAGDTMTGQLVAPSFNASQGTVYLKAASGSTQATDAYINVDTPTSTVNGGRLVFGAGYTYTTGNATVVGSGSFQGALSSAGLITGAGLQINGNATVTGTITTTTVQVNGGLTVNGAASLTGGSAGGITTSSGILNIYPGGNSNAGNAHVWFRNTDGSTRGILYAQNGGTVTLAANGGTVCANFYAGGNASFNGITTGTINASGRIVGTDCVFSGNVYSGSGGSWLATDGNVYGGAWGGYLSTYLGANMITPTNMRGNLASIRAGELGSYALLQHPGGGDIGPNGSVAGTDMSWATCAGAFNERVGYGTWCVMGRIRTGSLPVATTLCMRYA